jgi:RHS repeat-associated protein
MAINYSKYDFYVTRAAGVPPHSKWEAVPGGFHVFDLTGSKGVTFAKLRPGATHADVVNAYRNGGSNYEGQKQARSLVTMADKAVDEPPPSNPGYDGLGPRFSVGQGTGTKKGSSEKGGGKKPARKKPGKTKKKPDNKKPSGGKGTGGKGSGDGPDSDPGDKELEDAKRKVQEAFEKLQDKIEQLEDVTDKANDKYRDMDRIIDRLKELGVSIEEIKRRLEKLRRTLLQYRDSKGKISAVKANAKNFLKLFQQKWRPSLQRRNKNFQPDAPLGKGMVSGDPVNLVSGAFTSEHTDVALPGRTMPLAVTRSYSNQIYCHGSFGAKWTSWFDAHCRQMKSGAVYVWLGNGIGVWFLPDGKGGFQVPQSSSWRLVKSGSRFRLENVEGATQQFDSAGRIQKISDRFGNWTRVLRNEHGHATGLRNSTAREVTFSGWPIREVKDSSGRVWKYRYDSRQNLIQVTLPKTKKLPKGRSTYYEYENGSDPRTWSNLKRIRDTNGELALENIYGTRSSTFNRVVDQEAAGEGVSFQYIPIPKAKVEAASSEGARLNSLADLDESPRDVNAVAHRAVFTDAKGLKTSHDFNEAGQPLESMHRAFSENAESHGRFEYDALGNVVAAHELLGNAVLFKRDVKNRDPLRRSNALEIRQHPRGNGAPLVTKIEYGDFNQPVRIQNPDGSVTTSTLNNEGLVERVVPPAVTLAGKKTKPETRMKWNRFGQPVEVVDAAGRKMTFVYYSSGNGAGLPKEQRLNGKRVAQFRYDSHGRPVETSDVFGVATEHEYDELDQLLKVSEPSILDTAVRYEYNELGLLTSEAVRNLDAAGKARSPEWITTWYRHDKKGRVVSVEEMLTATEMAVSKLAWDSDDNLIETQDAVGSVARFEYDDRAQLVRTVSNPGLKRGGREVVTTFEYDRNGNQTATVDSLGRRTTTKYDGHDRPLETIDPVGNRVKLKWHSKADRVLSARTTTKTGRLLGEVRSEYDELGRVTAEQERVFAPDGKTTGWLKSSVVYDVAGQVLAMIDPLGNRTELQYDIIGQLVSTRDSIGNVERTSYDDRGLVTSQISELVDGISPTKRQVFVQRFGYDDLGRLIWQQDGLGNRSTHQWDGLNRLVGQVAADRSAERFEYDLAGRMVQQIHSDKTTSHWRYDAGGRLLDMTNGRGQITRLSYDEWHDPVSARLPDGTLLFEHRYDAAGRIVESTDARGVKVRTTFDKLSQPTREDISLRGNAEGVTRQDFTWDRWSNLSTATNGTHKVQQISDSLGRTHRETVDGRSIEWTFGKNHLLDEVKYPDGFKVQHHWDQHGRLRALQPRWPGGGFQVRGSGSAGPLATFDYLGAELPQRHTYGNGMQTTSQLDAAGRLLSLKTKDKNGKTVEQIDTLRDAAGLVKSLLRGGLHATACDYDDTGQLVEVREGTPVASPDLSAWLPSGSVSKPDPAKSQSDLVALLLTLDPAGTARETTKYEYDAAGNRKRVRRTKAGKTTSTNYSADSADRYSQVGGATQKYDAAGNLIDDGRYRFRYDGFSRLTRVTDSQTGKDVLSQSYDPFGRVTKRTADGAEETMAWDGADLIFSQTVTGGQVGGATSTRAFIPGLAIDEPLAEIDSQGVHHLHPDPTSSVIAVSDSHGKITERFHYGAFGEASGTFDAAFKPTLSFSNSRARFQGREQLGSLPYLDFRSRAYSPAHGRFLQTDPIGLAGDSNQYRFALNNPLSFMDPMGTDPVGTGGGNSAFDQNADLNNRAYTHRGAAGWMMTFFESMLMAGCPFLMLAAQLQQMNAQAMQNNRSGKSRSYLKEFFNLAKLLPVVGGLLGLGELGVRQMTGNQPTPKDLLPQLLGGLLGGLVIGTGGFRTGAVTLRTPTVGGYGRKFSITAQHHQFLNTLRAKGLRRRMRRIQPQLDAIRRARDLVNTNQTAPPRLSRLNTLPRRGTAGGAYDRGALSQSLGRSSEYRRIRNSLPSRNITHVIDDSAPPPGSVGSFTGTGFQKPQLQGIVYVWGRNLHATGETLAEFTRRVVGVLGHENWHSRQRLEFGRASNRLDELLARMTQFQLQNPQGYQHKGISRLDAKPTGTWTYLEWLRLKHRDSGYGHLPSGVPNSP